MICSVMLEIKGFKYVLLPRRHRRIDRLKEGFESKVNAQRKFSGEQQYLSSGACAHTCSQKVYCCKSNMIQKQISTVQLSCNCPLE